MQTNFLMNQATLHTATTSFLKYFKDFKDSAPSHFVNYGGYHTGLPNGMASSLESCLAFYEYIDDPSATLLNAGAGASSAVFRSIFQNVTCTDPDREYLEAVSSIVGGDNYIYNLGNCDYADYVYWDYGNWQRRPLMDVGLHLAKKAMYIDDCHDADVLSYAEKLANLGNHKIIKTNSIDQFGRFGIIIEKIS
jgi:hypothetical protein